MADRNLVRVSSPILAVFVAIFCLADVATYSSESRQSCQTNRELTDRVNLQNRRVPVWCLVSDWKAADWLTFGLVVIGFMQTLVFSTQAARLRETIEKMDEISKGQSTDIRDHIAQSARLANATEEAGRAWINFDGFDRGTASNVILDGSDVGEGFWFSPVWRNGGGTPAKKARIFVHHKLIGPHEEVPTFIANYEKGCESTLPQGSKVNADQRIIVKQDLSDAMSGKRRVIVFTSVEYFDVFLPTAKRSSEFTAELTFNGMVWHQGKFVHNAWLAPVGPQNGCT